MIPEKVKTALAHAFGKPPAARNAPGDEAPAARFWDVNFRQWIDGAAARGVDPNDVGDEAWANDRLAGALEDRYLKYVPAGGTVLELGPGTGRLTRHLIGKVRAIELVDNSKFVIDWMEKYLRGKVEFRTHLIDLPRFPAVADSSVDTVLAHGVFEHLDFDETYSFLVEFHRVLKPGGYVSYNYDTLHNAEGANWFFRKLKPGKRCVFRFYTPEFMGRIAQLAKFEVAQSITSDDRLAHVVLLKP